MVYNYQLKYLLWCFLFLGDRYERFVLGLKYCDILIALFYYYLRKLFFCITNHAEILKLIKWFSNWVFGFHPALAHPVFKITFQPCYLRDFLATVGMLSCELLCVLFCSVFSRMLRDCSVIKIVLGYETSLQTYWIVNSKLWRDWCMYDNINCQIKFRYSMFRSVCIVCEVFYLF